MRALVTGAAGFIGRHISQTLREHGYDVDRVDTTLALGVRQVNALDVFRRPGRADYDLCVHCAAIVGGRETIDRRPAEQIVDFELDAAMFRWAAKGGARRVVYFSSSAAYPVYLQHGHHARRLQETDIDFARPKEPDSLYGWSKLTGEHLAAAARLSGLDVLVVRPFSGYGPDQDPCYPFPAICARAIRREDPLTVWGDGRQTRDFVHVDDVCAAIMALLDTGERGPVNIGTGTPTSMLDLAALAARAVGYSPQIRALNNELQGVSWRVADTARLNRVYTPTITIKQGVTDTVRKAVTP